MKWLAAAITLALAGCVTAAPNSVIRLAPGEAMTVRVNENSGQILSAEKSAAQPPSEMLQAIARAASAGLLGDASGPNYAPVYGGANTQLPPPGVVRVTLVMLPTRQTILYVENGYDQQLSYAAALEGGPRPGPTDVCTVRPHSFGVEQWPYLIDHIDLSALKLSPWRDGDQIVCAPPPRQT